MLWKIISSDPIEGIKRTTYVTGDLMYVDKDTGALHIQSYKTPSAVDIYSYIKTVDNAIFAKGQWDSVYQDVLEKGELNSKT